jgi:hypothetical protein
VFLLARIEAITYSRNYLFVDYMLVSLARNARTGDTADEHRLLNQRIAFEKKKIL